MKTVCGIQYKNGSKEESLPDFFPDFPYISSKSELDRYAFSMAPWHWHKAVELFYIEEGTVEYFTPNKTVLFPKGSGGFVNSNIIHMTKALELGGKTTGLLHIFDPGLISGQGGGRIEQKYVTPLTTASQVEIISLCPEDEKHAGLLKLLFSSLHYQESDPFYELKLRAALTEIWCGLLKITEPLLGQADKGNRVNDQLRLILVYIREHFSEKISVADMAAAAFVSERECFRLFHHSLRTTPVEYLNSFRLQQACRLLVESEERVTDICGACGLGSSSYFGKTFRDHMGCSPVQYRRKWRNNDIKGQ